LKGSGDHCAELGVNPSPKDAQNFKKQH